VVDSKRHLVYGIHAVRALLLRAPERVLALWLSDARDDARIQEIRALATGSGIATNSGTARTLERMAGAVVHQGVLAEVRPLRVWNEQDLGVALDAGASPPLLLVLDGVTDPHNLGACLRTADAAGALAVIIPKDRSARVDATARKVAAGAAEAVPVVAVTNLARTLQALKQRGIWVVGADEDGEKPLHRADLTGPLAIVLGAEGTGMRRLTREQCDYRLRIPMAGQVSSLNVSVAAGVILFEAVRQKN
jgi:23S rRNA (guanosine2251-2'-O)-methyltransferase